MAFVGIPADWIEAGKAIKKRLFTRIKENFDDHETRINAMEGGAAKIEVFNFEVMGYINNYTAAELTQIGTFRATIPFTITDAVLTLMNSPSSPTSTTVGILEIDIEKSTDSGLTWNTILSSRPQIGNGVNATGSKSGVIVFIDGEEAVAIDDMIRVNISSKKDTQGSFHILVYGEVS